MDAIHKLKMDDPHWYLWLLGVHPAHHGKRIGKSLLAPMLAKADADRIECYLETHNEANVPFHRNLGFDVAHKGTVPSQGLKVWSMARKPRV